MEPALEFVFTWMTGCATHLYISRVPEVPKSHLKSNL